MASAWLVAKTDLGLRVIHPFRFKSRSGVEAETVGVYLPDFGGPQGMILLCRFDEDSAYAVLGDSEYYSSSLNPVHYEPYRRQHFIRALSDWGWYGSPEETPAWIDPAWREKLPRLVP